MDDIDSVAECSVLIGWYYYLGNWSWNREFLNRVAIFIFYVIAGGMLSTFLMLVICSIVLLYGMNFWGMIWSLYTQVCNCNDELCY
jgi:hypothetical protein